MPVLCVILAKIHRLLHCST